jgi:HSP20 family protein
VFETQEGDELIVSERPQGVFSRQLFVSDALDTDRIEANYDRGVLTLELPVAEQAKPRRIQIGGADSERQMIEGTATRS